jgi:hypothetical protein
VSLWFFVRRFTQTTMQPSKLPMRNKTITRNFINQLGFQEWGNADFDGI